MSVLPLCPTGTGEADLDFASLSFPPLTLMLSSPSPFLAATTASLSENSTLGFMLFLLVILSLPTSAPSAEDSHRSEMYLGTLTSQTPRWALFRSRSLSEGFLRFSPPLRTDPDDGDTSAMAEEEHNERTQSPDGCLDVLLGC